MTELKELDIEILEQVKNKGWLNKKLIIQDETREEPCSEEGKYEFCEFGDCPRCACNNGVDINTIEISPIQSKEKLVFERSASHQIGSIWGNWYVVS